MSNSYDAWPDAVLHDNLLEHPSPYESGSVNRGVMALSKTERLLRVGVGCTFALVSSGVIFGLPPINDVLLDEGAFRSLCPDDFPEDETCDAQDKKMVIIFTVASSCFNLVSFFSGLLLDKFGPRIALWFGSLLFILGCVTVASVPSIISTETFYIIGFGLMGAGGPFMFQSFLHLSNLFPDHSGIITTMTVAALEGSCVVFALMNSLYFEAHLSHKTQFFAYACVVGAFALFYWHPKKAYQKVAPLSQSNGKVDYRLALKAEPLWQQVQTWHYGFFACFMVSGLYRVNFFTATVEVYLKTLTSNDDLVHSYVQLFGWILAIGGVLSVPIVGKCLDTFSVEKNLTLLATLGLLMNACICVPNMQFQIVTFCLMSVFRAALFSTLCLFLTYVFGWSNYGGLLGLSTFLTGIISFSIDPLHDLIEGAFDGKFIYVNAVFTVVALLRFYMPFKFGREEAQYGRSASDLDQNVVRRSRHSILNE